MNFLTVQMISLCKLFKGLEKLNMNDKTNEIKLTDFVYIERTNEYYDKHEDSILSVHAFNAKYGYLNKGKGSAATAFSKIPHDKKTCVVETVYEPKSKSRIVKKHDKMYLNTYRTAEIDEQLVLDPVLVQYAVKPFLNMIDVLCGEDSESHAGNLLDWFAWQLQKPGELVEFAVVIKSIESVGKDLTLSIFRELIGSENVNDINSKTLTKEFDDYAVGSAVKVIQELRLGSKRSVEVLNNLKTKITNRIIEIERKGEATQQVDNVSNYLAFTNFDDGLPVLKDDTRFFYLDVGVDSLEQIKPRDYASHSDLIQALVRLKDDSSLIDQLRLYLTKHHKISEWFLNERNRAPSTKAKAELVERNETNLNGYAEVTELLEVGSEGYCSKVVILSELLKDVNAKVKYPMKTQALSKMLDGLGFTKTAKNAVTYKNKRVTAWVANDVEYSEPKELVSILKNENLNI